MFVEILWFQVLFVIPPPREEALQKSDIIQIANFSKNINSSHVRKYIFPLTQN